MKTNCRCRHAVLLMSAILGMVTLLCYPLDMSDYQNFTVASAKMVDVSPISAPLPTAPLRSSHPQMMSDLMVHSAAAWTGSDQSLASFSARLNGATYRKSSNPVKSSVNRSTAGVVGKIAYTDSEVPGVTYKVPDTTLKVPEATVEVHETTAAVPETTAAKSNLRKTSVRSERARSADAVNKRRQKVADGGMVAEYCNLPESVRPADEGSAPKGYKLVSVHAVIRHGVRVPMNASLSLGPLKFPKIRCRLSVSGSSMPRVIKDFISKTSNISKTNTSWKYPLRSRSIFCKPAELTPVGVQQQINIGQLLGQVYSSQLNVTQDNLRILSTHKIRTYQSVIALVFGLLRGDVDYRHLHIESLSNNALCRSVEKRSCRCARADSLWFKGQRQVARTVHRSDPYFREFNNSMYRSLGTQYSSVHSYYPWRTAHSMMASRLCNKLSLCNKGRCLTESLADANWKSLKFYHQALSSNSVLNLWAKVSMYNFLGQLTSRLSQQSTQPNSTQDTISVYSAHDNTLIPLLLALGLPVKQWPSYSSRLVIELYKPTTRNQGYLFKVVSNGEDVTRDLKFCGPELKGTGACSLQFLINYYLNILVDTGYSNYNDACRIPD